MTEPSRGWAEIKSKWRWWQPRPRLARADWQVRAGLVGFLISTLSLSELGTVVQLDYANCKNCSRDSADLALLVFLPDEGTSWSRWDFSHRKLKNSSFVQLENKGLPAKGHQWKISRNKKYLYEAESSKVWSEIREGSETNTEGSWF